MAVVLEKLEPQLEESITQLDEVQVRTLQALINTLRVGLRDTDNAKTFVYLFGRAVKVLRRSDVELARKLKVARPTIGRWVRGEHLPHGFMRPAVIRALVSMAEADVRALEKAADAQARPSLIRKVAVR